MSAWMEVLRRECDRTSLSDVGRRINYSAAAVSQVLSGNYAADTRRFERAVRGALMDQTVDCPVVGELTMDVCLQHQGRPFAATNPTRVQLYKACRNGCPHTLIGDKS